MKIRNILIIGVLSLVLSNCDSDFDTINTDPNNPTDISVDLELGSIERSLIGRTHDYFLAGEAAATWPQHLSKPVYNDADRYFPRIGSIDNLWSVLYASVINEADDMYGLAELEGNQAVQGVALTLKAIALQTLTDAFGDIPASQANGGLDGNFTPVFDTQMSVYTQIFDMLDQAMSKLNGSGAISASQDLIYGGDIAKWKKLAATIKFKALMRVSGTSLLDTGAMSALANSGNLITSNADNAFISFTTQTSPNRNPFYGIRESGREGEWCMGKALIDYMDSNGDPRIAVYAQEVGGNGSGNGYVGKPAGYINPGLSGYAPGTVSQIGDAFMLADAPLYLATAAHTNLLLAEAAANGWVGGDAATYFRAGIDESLVQHGLSAGTYNIPYTGLESIAGQLWVSTFFQGYETWAEWRRTDFPTLDLAIDPQPGVNSIPTRFTYPTSEVNLNNANVQAANNNQGADALTTKVWWDNN